MRCKKLVFKEDKRTFCIYGIITEENDNHVYFKTADKSYMVHKNNILVLTDTNREFTEDTLR